MVTCTITPCRAAVRLNSGVSYGADIMTFWKTVQDRVVLSRLEEEALHAAALDSFENGERRKGLWAKALIEAEGDQPKAESVYLRLLVAALKDEMYVMGRAQEKIALQSSAGVIDAAVLSPPPAVPSISQLQREAKSALDGRGDFHTCEALIRAAGGTVEPKGLFFGMHYLVALGGHTYRLNNFDDLLQWVRANLPIAQWASGHS